MMHPTLLLLLYILPVVLGSTPLRVITIDQTPNGFTHPPRGWNSYGQIANPGVNQAFRFDRGGVRTQADGLSNLLTDHMKSAHDYYISLDSGWSIGSYGDDYGRIIPDTSLFDIPALADYVHRLDMKLGVYVVPGAFCNDREKTIFGTESTIGEILNFPEENNGMSRCNLNFTKRATQTWHDSVVALFASWGVDLIKLDFITPGSPQANDVDLPPDGSGSVIAFHKAIAASGRSMRLDISWKLERNLTFFSIWESNADSMRTDQDVNNEKNATFVHWGNVYRAIENYRQYIVQVAAETEGRPLSIYPDMDNLYVANGADQSGISDIQRQTIMTHWIGAAANLIDGSDMTRVDDLGVKLLTDPAALEVANFTQRYPMQPRNPGTGGNLQKQLQSWIAGPDECGQAVVVLANYGSVAPDAEHAPGLQQVAATWEDLGIDPACEVFDVWNGEVLSTTKVGVEAILEEGESVLLWISSRR